MNYTEGPWTWENYHDTHTALIRIANLKPGDKRTVLFHAAAWEILPADKNLIQAAPDMYEALKEFENQLPELWGDGIRNGKVTLTLDADVIDGIMDAIRKAEGRTD